MLLTDNRRKKTDTRTVHDTPPKPATAFNSESSTATVVSITCGASQSGGNVNQPRGDEDEQSPESKRLPK